MSRNGQVDQRRSEFTGIPRVFVVTTNIVLVRATEKGSISEHQNSMHPAAHASNQFVTDMKGARRHSTRNTRIGKQAPCATSRQ